MNERRYGPVALLLALALSNPGRADDQAEARALVDKAIAAQGGQAKLEKFKAVNMKFKGTVRIGDTPLPFTGEIAFQGLNQSRLATELEMGGQKFRLVVVLNRDKGWTRVNDMVIDMDEAAVARAKDDAYANWVASLFPLKEKGYTLASVGEVKVESLPAVGVRVSGKGRPDVSLFFDKKSNLLVKTEYRAKDEAGKEVNQENFLSDYKEIEGTKQAMKVKVTRDGKTYVEIETTEIKPEEKLDDSVFDKP